MHNPLILLTTLLALLFLHANLTTSQPLPSNGADNMDLTAETMPGAPQPENTMSTTPLTARWKPKGPPPKTDDEYAHLAWLYGRPTDPQRKPPSKATSVPKGKANIPKLVPRDWNSFWHKFWVLTVGSRGIKHSRSLAARGNFAGTKLVPRDDEGWGCVLVQLCPKSICRKKWKDCGLI
ncbi:MAG: hypothetical protein Q9221_007224 [Calogaya cf. arnoldii]